MEVCKSDGRSLCIDDLVLSVMYVLVFFAGLDDVVQQSPAYFPIRSAEINEDESKSGSVQMQQ